ncbi:hypothetical protein JWG39_00520 [Desulforhopalus vacuolatus]|uniref:hypothetical protein n=1 Tax=Desulforhopalus vacuolatus TaxID=40414 RepID=UPI0019640E14|nr:hypothetical protein [Desulforhopalus vacuolatus]MBM9518298.1 hypothetical protein [Desulforhopalus vacuolatus]
MDLVLQIWGGTFYLSNKILLALSEGRTGSSRKKFKISAWLTYLIGVPAWVTILVSHQNWIASSIEAGATPAMLLGLYNAYYDNKKPNKAFNNIVTVITCSSLIFGLSYSISYHSGITSISQVMEVGMMSGFLLGSNYLAKGKNTGWLFFMLMNMSTAALMLLQEKQILMVQQLLSLFFVMYGYNKTRLKQN